MKSNPEIMAAANGISLQSMVKAYRISAHVWYVFSLCSTSKNLGKDFIMEQIGTNIRLLRRTKNITQEELASALHISYQAVSKWENNSSQPDIALIPAIANYFGISIDELFGFKLQAMTNKERFIRFMADTGVLTFGDFALKSGGNSNYYINSENFCTNAQIAKLGEFFADCIREEHIEFDCIAGMAYHGISFAAATAIALYQKYGITTNFCHDRKVKDSRGRMVCGHMPEAGERIVVMDDLVSSGRTLGERLGHLLEETKARVAAVLVIAQKEPGAALLKEKYGAKVLSVIRDKDIACAMKDGIV